MVVRNDIPPRPLNCARFHIRTFDFSWFHSAIIVQSKLAEIKLGVSDGCSGRPCCRHLIEFAATPISFGFLCAYLRAAVVEVVMNRHTAALWLESCRYDGPKNDLLFDCRSNSLLSYVTVRREFLVRHGR